MSTNRKPSEEKVWRNYFDQTDKTFATVDITVYEYLNRLPKDKSTPILAYYGKQITFGDMLATIERFADSFAAMGIQEGDHVAFVTGNLPETLYSFYALNKIGAVSMMIDPRMGPDNIKHFINLVNARAVIVIDRYFEKAWPIIDELAVAHTIVHSPADSLPTALKVAYRLKAGKVKLPARDNVMTTKQFLALQGKKSEAVPYKVGSVAAITQTGGTTGTPKGVMLTNLGLNSIAYNFSKVGTSEEIKTFLGIIPMFSSYGLASGCHAPMALGAQLILVPDFTPEKFPNLLKKYKPNAAIAVPSFYEKILSSKLFVNEKMPYPLCWMSGGDNMTEDLEIRLESFLTERGCGFPISQGYGLSETSSATTLNFRGGRRRGSIGLPMLTSEFGVFEPGTTEELGYNEVGELCIAGDSLMGGYYNNPEETAKVMIQHPDGKVWLHSGDLGYIDEDGFVFFKSRIKRLMPRFDGHKLFPTQIEEVICQLPTVADCAVVGVRDKDHANGWLPLAIVQKNADCAYMDEALISQIVQYCQKNFDERSQPCAVVVVDEIPLTPLGKHDTKKLEEDYRDFEYRNL